MDNNLAYRPILTHTKSLSSKQTLSLCPNSKKKPVEYNIKKINFVAYNARSLHKDFNQYSLLKFLEEESPDIVLVKEVWKGIPSYLLMKHCYNLLYSNHKDYTGAAIISKSHFKLTSPFPALNNEFILVGKIIMDKGRHILLMSAYFPPDGERKTVQQENLKQILTQICGRYKEFSLLFYADFNEDLRVGVVSKKSKTRNMLEKLGNSVLNTKKTRKPILA